MGLSQIQSNGIVSFFFASNFILHFAAGYIGDKLLSNRLLFAVSTIIQAVGLIILNYYESFIYLGLSLFLIGSGFGSTCINCLITQLFSADESPLREKAFFLNYSAMNIGFLSGFLLSGFIDIKDNYDHLFEMSNVVSLMIGFFIIKSWKYLTKESATLKLEIKKGKMGLFCLLLLIPVLAIGFDYTWIANILILTFGILALLYIFAAAKRSNNITQQRKIYSFVILAVSSILFWMLYFVGPLGVAQFLKYNVNSTIGSYLVPPQWLMNLNSIFVIIGSPCMIFLINRLRMQNIVFTICNQFVFSLSFIALSFVWLALGVLTVNDDGLTGMIWIVGHYLFQSIGELLIAPVGYAMIGHLAPKKLQGSMMGIWMMAPGISATLANYFSNLMTKSESLNPLISNEYYMKTFTQLGLCALLGAFLLWWFSKSIDKIIETQTIQQSEKLILD